MSNKPRDPAQGSIDQNQNIESSFDGQEGYGVEYEQERFQGDGLEAAPQQGRSGSYETGNTGGYGMGGVTESDQPTDAPADPESQQGQGGQ
jgi:hypothetical protein